MEDVVNVPIGETRAVSTASGGTALTTTAKFIEFPTGTDWFNLVARNFATAVVLRWALNPYLVILKTTDALVAVANVTDYSENAQDADSATNVTLGALDTAANNNYLYVGSHIPFRGVQVVNANANAIGSVLTVKYWKGSTTTWTTVAGFADGTASAGATFAQNGNVTWTLPTDWTAASLSTGVIPASAKAIGDSILANPAILLRDFVYWTRWQVSVLLSATVNNSSMTAMNRKTTYAELTAGLAYEQRIARGLGGIGCLEVLVDAGTGNLIVNAGTTRTFSKFAG